MDHQHIEEHDLVDRYLLGSLSTDERARFEDHFVDCTQCLDDLDLARDFRQALRDGVAETMVRGTLRAGLAGWLTRPRRGWVLGLCGGFAALSTVWMATAWLASGRPGSVRGRASLEPQVNIPAYVLGVTRGDSSPVVESPVSEWLALEMEVGDLVGVDERSETVGYRVTVREVGGEITWRRDVEPDHLGLIKLTLPPGSLPVGDYRLELEGLKSGDKTFLLEAHRLRLVD